jgi:PST family polysaccharide transporter
MTQGRGEIPEQRPADLRSRSARGFAWKALGVFVSQPITLLTTVLLARLLTPEDFGLVAMANVFVGLAALVNEFGLTSALVQRRALSEDEVQSAFWLNLVIGLVVVLAGAVAGRPLAAFFDEPRLTVIVPVASLTFIVSSLALVPSALFARAMDFRPSAIGSIWSAAAALLTSVVLGLLGAGVWAIVCGGLVGTAALTVYLIAASSWRPRFHFGWTEVRPLVRFGGLLTAAALLTWGSWNVDNVLIGRYLGGAELGAYAVAFTLASVPARRLSSTILTTFLPAFARVPDQEERFRSAYVDALTYAALPVGVVLAALGALSEEVVIGLYGSQWSAAVDPLRVLCIAGFVIAVSSLTGLVFRGLGKPGLEAFWSGLLLAGCTVGSAAGVRFGITGVAIGVTAGIVVTRSGAQMAANRIVGIPVRRFAQALGPAAVGALMTAISALALRYALMAAGVPALPRLLIAAPLAVGVTWLIVRRTRFGLAAREIEILAREVVSAWRRRPTGDQRSSRERK